MKRTSFLVFLILFIFKNQIDCGPGSLDDPIDNLIKIEFDLDNLNTDDYTIKRNRYKPAGYQFIPKPDRTITNVKIEGRTVWMRHKSLFVLDIIIYFPNFEDLKYSINISDPKGNADSIHYYHKDQLNAVGIMDYYNNIEWRWLFFSEQPTFDLNSPFDYRNEITTILESDDKVHRIAEVNVRGLRQLYEIYDGKTLIYKAAKDKKVKKIVYSWKNGRKLLLKLQLDFLGNEFVYFKYNDDKWESIGEDDYAHSFVIERMLLANQKIEQIEKNPLFNLNLLDIIYSNNELETHRFIMGIPTITITFKLLQAIKDGSQSLLDRILEGTKVYLYRGEFSFEMIEIIHHYSINKETGEETNKINDKSTVKTRGLNYYFVKNNGKWTEVSQSVFFYRFKKLVKSNLENFNRKLMEEDGEDNQGEIDRNIILIENTDELKFIDDTERIETKEVDLTNDAVNETRDKPGSTITGRKQPEYKPKKPETRTIHEPSQTKPKEEEWASEETRPPSRYRFAEPEPKNVNEQSGSNQNKKPKNLLRLVGKPESTKTNTETADQQPKGDEPEVKEIEIEIEEKETEESKEKEKKKGGFYTLSITSFLIFLLI